MYTSSTVYKILTSWHSFFLTKYYANVGNIFGLSVILRNVKQNNLARVPIVINTLKITTLLKITRIIGHFWIVIYLCFRLSFIILNLQKMCYRKGWNKPFNFFCGLKNYLTKLRTDVAFSIHEAQDILKYLRNLIIVCFAGPPPGLPTNPRHNHCLF